MCAAIRHVRFIPESGHQSARRPCLFWAISEHLTLFDHSFITWLRGDPKIPEVGAGSQVDGLELRTHLSL